MPLLTIADLQQPAEYKKQYIQHAMQLTSYWNQWKLQHDGNLDVYVKYRGEKDRKAGVHASELSGCLRKLVYSISGEKRLVRPEDKNLNMQRRFDLGTAMHAVLQAEFHEMCKWASKWMTDAYLQFEDEIGIHPGLGGIAAKWKIFSHTDGIFTFGHNGFPFLRVAWEFKTCSAPEFEKLRETQERHKEQTCLYMKALDVPLVWVHYYNKSNSYDTKSEPPYLMQFNERLWSNKLEPRIAGATEMAQQGQLPAREEGTPCSWCPFAHTCKPSYLRQSSGPAIHTVSPREFLK